MFSVNQFEDFLTLENFRLAFSRLQTAPRTLYKELYYEDIQIFGLFLDKNIEVLLNEINQGTFKPESSYKIFIPKKNNLVRPLSLLKFRDLLVYQSIINTIADIVYDDIAPDTYLLLSIPDSNEADISEYNNYIIYIAFNNMNDYITSILKKDFFMSDIDLFFNHNTWADKDVYKELNLSFRLFYEYRVIDPSKSLLNLNGFNNLVYDKICEILKIKKPSKEYGVNLDSGCIDGHLPFTNRYFTEINKYRNQRTEAHPYDKHGTIRTRINMYELEKLIEKQIKALKEICKFNFSIYL